MIPLFDDAGGVERSRTVVVLLILTNVLAFLYELSVPDLHRFILDYALIPAHITHGFSGNSPVQPVYLTLLTSMFLHGGWLHIGSNMLFLWVFGDEVEGTMGSIGFLIFYLVSGCVAGLVQSYMLPDSTIPTIGASGAIAGVLGAYIVRFPRARVMTFVGFFFLFLPAWLVLGLWAVTQWFQGVAAIEGASSAANNVAVFAHLGGFVFGAAVMVLVRIGIGLESHQPGPPQYPFYSSRRPW